MKRICFALAAALVLCLPICGNTPVTEVNDTLATALYENRADTACDNSRPAEESTPAKSKKSHAEDKRDSLKAETLVSIVAIVFCFSTPILLILLVFHFRHKNRMAKYRLIEQALAAGQQLPPELFGNSSHTPDNIRSKGIQSIALGIGLFIFLWAIIDFSMGCIGLLIMFMGFGQVVIYYTQQRDVNRQKEPPTETKQDETAAQ